MISMRFIAIILKKICQLIFSFALMLLAAMNFHKCFIFLLIFIFIFKFSREKVRKIGIFFAKVGFFRKKF